MESITSRRNPIVARFRRAAGRGSGREAAVLLDGEHLVEEAMAAGVAIEIAAFARAALETSASVRRLADRVAAAGGRVLAVSNEVLEAMSPTRHPSGVTALAGRPRWTIDDLLAPAPALVLMTVDVQDPGNVGAIVRTAHGAGASGVVVSGTSADAFSWKALRGSMGSAFHLPVVRTVRTTETLEWARRCGLVRCALVPADGSPLFQADLRRPVLLLVGGEGAGLPDPVREIADEAISIPMRRTVSSLNAAAAAAVALYEAHRQRHSEDSAA